MLFGGEKQGEVHPGPILIDLEGNKGFRGGGGRADAEGAIREFGRFKV